jgi:hypothetical protein
MLLKLFYPIVLAWICSIARIEYANDGLIVENLTLSGRNFPTSLLSTHLIFQVPAVSRHVARTYLAALLPHALERPHTTYRWCTHRGSYIFRTQFLPKVVNTCCQLFGFPRSSSAPLSTASCFVSYAALIARPSQLFCPILSSTRIQHTDDALIENLTFSKRNFFLRSLIPAASGLGSPASLLPRYPLPIALSPAPR